MVFEYRVIGTRKQRDYLRIVKVKDTDFTARTQLEANSENIRRDIVHRLMKDGVIIKEIQPVEPMA